jgi:hypothetical protein
MTETGNSYRRPQPLRTFLDAGGDLTAFTLLDSLVEAIVVARRLLPAETNRKQASRNRKFVERWFERHGDEPAVPATQELLTFAWLKAECLADPDLAERFETCLPPDVLARSLQLVADLRHIHPLAVVEDLSTWTCRACGESFTRSPAAVVTNTGEELGYDEDLTYCIGCLSIATAALETACGIDRFSESIDNERMRMRPVPGAAAGDDTDEIVITDEAMLLDDEESVRQEAARLTSQLEASQRRMAALEARRAALIQRLEGDKRFRPGGD